MWLWRPTVRLRSPTPHDPVAQSAEHLPFKQGVRGSNPRWVTKKSSPTQVGLLFLSAGIRSAALSKAPVARRSKLRSLRFRGNHALSVKTAYRSVAPPLKTGPASPRSGFVLDLRVQTALSPFPRKAFGLCRDNNSHLAANAAGTPAYATGRQRRGCGNSAPPFSAPGSGGTEFLSKPDPLRRAPVLFFGETGKTTLGSVFGLLFSFWGLLPRPGPPAGGRSPAGSASQNRTRFAGLAF